MSDKVLPCKHCGLPLAQPTDSDWRTTEHLTKRQCIAALAKRLEEAEAGSDAYQTMLKQAEADVTALRAENEALRKLLSVVDVNSNGYLELPDVEVAGVRTNWFDARAAIPAEKP